MKLAEALSQRSDLAKRMLQLQQRLQRNVLVQEGEAPAEDPARLIAEYEQLADEFRRLVARINLTNASTVFGAGTLTDALAERDVLNSRIELYREAAKAATVTRSISTRSEVRFRPTVPVVDMQKQADDLSQQLRKLDFRIQETNWQTDLK